MNIIKNYIYNVSYQLLVIILPIITTPYISRVLKVDGVGRYSVSAAVVNYFVLFGMLGISTYGNRQIAYTRDNLKKMSRVFWEINLLRLITMSLSLAAYCIFVIFYVPAGNKLLYGLQIFTLLASLADISWFFYGIEDFRKTATKNIVIKLLSISGIFLFVKREEDIWKYALIIAGSAFLGQCVLWKDIPRKLLWVAPDKARLGRHLKKTVLLWAPALAIQVYSSLDKIMLGILTNDTQAGLFENSQKLVKIASTITTALSTVTLPRISNYYHNKNQEGFKKIVEQSFSMVSFLALPMAFGILAVRETLVPWFYGSGYESISRLLIISVWLIVTLSWSSIFGVQVLIGCNREKQYIVSVTAGAVLNIILNLLFIRRYEAAGSIAASVLAEYTGMLLMLFFIRDIVDVKRLFAPVPRYFAVSIVMYFPVFYVGRLLGRNFLSTLVQALTGISIYVVLMLLLKDSCICYLLNKCRAVSRKRRRREAQE